MMKIEWRGFVARGLGIAVAWQRLFPSDRPGPVYAGSQQVGDHHMASLVGRSDASWRRVFLVVAAGILVVAATPYTTFWWRWLRDVAGPARDTFTLAWFTVLALAAGPHLIQQPRTMVLWLAGLVAVGTALFAHVPLEAERLHVVQYALLGVLSDWAMPRGRRWAHRVLIMVAWTLALGCVEEWWQWWLPNRVGEWRDVLLDGLGGVVGSYALIPWSVRARLA